jgi:uracil-DNA glycosylase family 4
MMRHPVEVFSEALDAFTDYPPDVTKVPELLPGTAAFAASAGLCRPPGSRELPRFPDRGVMVIGHNLDSNCKYEERRKSGISHGDEVPGTPLMSTWVGLYKLLELAGVPRNQIFFTNIFVGLKKGKPTGSFTRYATPEFKRSCREFLGLQVTTMRPRVVLVLGDPACRAIAELATPTPWPSTSLPPPVAIAARLFGHDTVLVPAHHPSMQKRIARDSETLRAAWNQTEHRPPSGVD